MSIKSSPPVPSWTNIDPNNRDMWQQFLSQHAVQHKDIINNINNLENQVSTVNSQIIPIQNRRNYSVTGPNSGTVSTVYPKWTLIFNFNLTIPAWGIISGYAFVEFQSKSDYFIRVVDPNNTVMIVQLIYGYVALANIIGLYGNGVSGNFSVQVALATSGTSNIIASGSNGVIF